MVSCAEYKYRLYHELNRDISLMTNVLALFTILMYSECRGATQLLKSEVDLTLYEQLWFIRTRLIESTSSESLRSLFQWDQPIQRINAQSARGAAALTRRC